MTLGNFPLALSATHYATSVVKRLPMMKGVSMSGRRGVLGADAEDSQIGLHRDYHPL